MPKKKLLKRRTLDVFERLSKPKKLPDPPAVSVKKGKKKETKPRSVSPAAGLKRDSNDIVKMPSNQLFLRES